MSRSGRVSVQGGGAMPGDRRSEIPSITERQFQDMILELARFTGWLAYHTYDSRRSQAGFPDLLLVRGMRVLFIELKSEKGKVRPEQKLWLANLTQAVELGASIEVYIWRPADFEQARRALL